MSCSDSVNELVSSAVFPGQQNFWNCVVDGGDGELKTTASSCFVYLVGGSGVNFAYCSCSNASGRRRELLGFEESAEVTMRRLAKAAQRYIDLTECNSMEWGYRLTNIVTAVLSPLLDKMGISPEYEMPLISGGSFSQPRPLEASISALLVGLNSPYFYGVHLTADLARAYVSFMDVVVNNAFGPNPCVADSLNEVRTVLSVCTLLEKKFTKKNLLNCVTFSLLFSWICTCPPPIVKEMEL